jgi:hypothetical protein
MYKIKNYSKEQAKKLNVEIKSSTRKNKKIDVYRGDKKIASIGDIRYDDYPTYIEKKGLNYAKKRRDLYKIRHNKHRNIKGSNSFYADKILW